MGVSENWLCFINALPADFDHLDNQEKKHVLRYFGEKGVQTFMCGVLGDFINLPGGSRHLIEPCPSSPAFENKNLWPLSPAPLRAEGLR